MRKRFLGFIYYRLRHSPRLEPMKQPPPLPGTVTRPSSDSSSLKIFAAANRLPKALPMSLVPKLGRCFSPGALDLQVAFVPVLLGSEVQKHNFGEPLLRRLSGCISDRQRAQVSHQRIADGHRSELPGRYASSAPRPHSQAPTGVFPYNAVWALIVSSMTAELATAGVFVGMAVAARSPTC